MKNNNFLWALNNSLWPFKAQYSYEIAFDSLSASKISTDIQAAINSPSPESDSIGRLK